MKNLTYEPKTGTKEYVTRHTYLPDFVNEAEPNIVYEAKGRFRTFQEAKKYIWIKESNPELIIRFLLGERGSKNRAYPQTKMTMGDWLTKHGFEWAEENDVPEEWKG